MPNEPEMIEAASLLPCPFCGSDELKLQKQEPGQFSFYYVDCLKCYVSTDPDKLEKAVEHWNTRAARQQTDIAVRDAWTPINGADDLPKEFGRYIFQPTRKHDPEEHLFFPNDFDPEFWVIEYIAWRPYPQPYTQEAKSPEESL